MGLWIDVHVEQVFLLDVKDDEKQSIEDRKEEARYEK